MGLPLILAFGAATLGAVAIYNALKDDDDDDYRDDEWLDRAKEQQRAEEQAQREREARERQARISLLEDKINDDINTAFTHLRIACFALQTSELFRVDFNYYKDEAKLSNLLSREADLSASEKFDAQNQLLTTKTNKNLALLDNCSSDIHIELSEYGREICKAYEECKQSELELTRRNAQLSDALKQLRQKHAAMRHAKAS